MHLAKMWAICRKFVAQLQAAVNNGVICSDMLAMFCACVSIHASCLAAIWNLLRSFWLQACYGHMSVQNAALLFNKLKVHELCFCWHRG
jgi:hypothetical protein